MNKFTIITINYNNKVGLQKTIKSVFDQSFGDYEYIGCPSPPRVSIMR